MRMEREDQGAERRPVRSVERRPHDDPVPAVHPIEIANGHECVVGLAPEGARSVYASVRHGKRLILQR